MLPAPSLPTSLSYSPRISAPCFSHSLSPLKRKGYSNVAIFYPKCLIRLCGQFTIHNCNGKCENHKVILVKFLKSFGSKPLVCRRTSSLFLSRSWYAFALISRAAFSSKFFICRNISRYCFVSLASSYNSCYNHHHFFFLNCFFFLLFQCGLVWKPCS